MTVASISGYHNELMSNEDVIVFTNAFVLTDYIPRGIGRVFQNLERFRVVSSRLKKISRWNFFGLRNLKTLDLRFNELQIVPDDAFLDLFNIEELNLSGNLIRKLPSNAFVSNMNMRYFDASYNEIKEFNDEMFSHNFQELREILLHNNKIRKIQTNLQKFREVEFVDLRKNECTDSLFFKDHPDYPLLSEYQAEIKINCTKKETAIALPAGTDYESNILENESLCERLALPLTKRCRTKENEKQRRRFTNGRSGGLNL